MPIDFKLPPPPTFDEAVEQIFTGLTEEEIKSVHEHGMAWAHHGPGQQMRNNWGLWNGSELKTSMMEKFGLGHADDMSGLILNAVEAKVRGEKFEPEDLVFAYKEHWTNMNLDPLTLKAIRK